MSELPKAILKTFLVFLAVFVIFLAATVLFNLDRVIFNSFLFDPQNLHNKKFRLFSIVITLLIAGLSSYFGYMIADKKNRNKDAWAALCFFFLNVWGLILLGFLPKIEKDDADARLE